MNSDLFDEIKNKVTQLLEDSTFTGWDIEKKTSSYANPVNRTTVANLRKGYSNLNNTTLGTVESLYRYAMEVSK